MNRAERLRTGPRCKQVAGCEKGAGAIDLVMVSAFLLIPTAMMLLGFPLMMEYRSMGDAAAREAARACATASDPNTGQSRAEAVVRSILNGRGLSPEGTKLKIECSNEWRPGEVVTAKVSFEVPAVSVVGFGSLGTVTIVQTYWEKIEHYRSAP